MKLLGINCKDHKQVEKGPHLTLQRDRNTDETLGETWSIIKLPHSISLQQDHVQPGLKPVPPSKHITRVIQHTTRVIPQGKDDEDSSILSEDVPSLEFLKSVQKSSVKEVPAVDKKDNEVTKGRLLIPQKKDHVKPVPKPVPPTKHTNKLNSQSQDEDSSNVSEDGPSLEFLKSVEKSVKKIQPTVPPFFAKNEVNVAQKEKVIRCPKKAFKNILFSLRMFPSQEKFSSMSLPMARIFYVLHLQPHPPLKPRLLLCPQLVVKPLLVVKNRIPS